ncbi:hypothetical protein [Helicobacter sp. 23-1045]
MIGKFLQLFGVQSFVCGINPSLKIYKNRHFSRICFKFYQNRRICGVFRVRFCEKLLDSAILIKQKIAEIA